MRKAPRYGPVNLGQNAYLGLLFDAGLMLWGFMIAVDWLSLSPWWVAGPGIPWFAWRIVDEGRVLVTMLNKRRDPIFNEVYLLMTQFPSATIPGKPPFSTPNRPSSARQRSRGAEDR